MIKCRGNEFRMSFSQNRVFGECPRKYELKYIEKIQEPSNPNLDLGNAIHLLCETHFYDSPTVTKEIADAIALVSKDRGALYMYHLAKQLADFFANKEILFNELKVTDDDFTCKIDVAYTIPGESILYLADFKVTKKPKTQDSVFEEGQLLFYQYMLRKSQDAAIPQMPRIKVQYINILSYDAEQIIIPTEPLEVSDSTCNSFAEGMKANMALINHEAFPKKTKWCKWCFYRNICDK